jgi:branched-subunit amino acid ABC-type transport system permease component
VLPFVITGIVTGSLYGLAGMGLVLTYRTSGVFNFGHGAIAAGAAFCFYSLLDTYGLPWPVAAAITLGLFGVVVGWAMERITRSLGDAPEAVVVVVTVGLALGVQGLLFWRYGNVTRYLPEFLPTGGFTVLGVNVSWGQVISVTLASLSAGGLYVFLRRSRLGVAMRAVVDNPTLIALTGERPAKVRMAAWAIGSGFAALSGMLLAPTLGLDATLLTLLVIQAFGACAIGLFSSLPLTYAGGLVVGVAASVATRYLTERPLSALPGTMPFLILVAVLLAVPVARLPKRRVSARSLVPDVKPLPPKVAGGLAAAGLLFLVVVPHVVGTYLPVWTSGLIKAVIYISLALLVWTSGQISLCHAGFLAIGATTMAHLTQGAGLPWGIALVLAGLCTVPIGALVAIPAIRLSGLYLALATLGFGFLLQNVVYPMGVMFGATSAVKATRPQLGFIDGTDDKAFYYLVLVVVVATVAAIAAIARTRLGRLLRAMAEAPTMLATQGLGVNMTRLIVFCVSTFFAGVAGALEVTQFGGASGDAYSPIQSLLFLAVLAICGTRLIGSSIAAALVIAVLPAYAASGGAGFADDTDRQLLIFGVVAILAGIRIAKRADIAAWLKAHAAAGRAHVADHVAAHHPEVVAPTPQPVVR